MIIFALIVPSWPIAACQHRRITSDWTTALGESGRSNCCAPRKGGRTAAILSKAALEPRKPWNAATDPKRTSYRHL